MHSYIVNLSSQIESFLLRLLYSGRGGISSVMFYIFIFSSASFILIFALSIFFSIVGVEAGQFGDFVGGTLNPILTFATFMGLILTILLQQSELKDTREELRRSATALEHQLSAIDRQNFENTFFQMVGIYNSIVNSIYVKQPNILVGGPVNVISGRECFSIFFSEYKRCYEKSKKIDEKSKFKAVYDEFWQVNQKDLSYYYRYLYNFLRFVHEYEGSLDKNKYTRIIKSQMSNYELALLFYIALNIDEIRYSVYIDSYNIFDKLPINMLINPHHRNLYSDSSFGFLEDAASEVWPPRKYINEIGELKAPIVKE